MDALDKTLDETAASVTHDMRRIMVPLLGFMTTLTFLAFVLLLSFKPSFSVIMRWLCLVLCGLQVFLGLFFWSSVVWHFVFELTLFALFGIFALLTNRYDHIRIFALSAIFHLFAILGHVTILGYSIPLFDAVAPIGPQDHVECHSYYNVQDEGLCAGYSNFLQFLAYILTCIQPLQAFAAYLSYKEKEDNGEDGRHVAPTAYGTIGDSAAE
ncbi:hypothetical protein QOT17_008740 [Balamuthia mandrillaris]